MVAFLFDTVIYVFLLLCMYILIVCFCIFIMPAGTPRLPWLRFFRAFSSVVSQMPGYNLQSRGTARTLPEILRSMYLFVLCHSAYCLCVNVYCATSTGWQPNLQFNKYILFWLTFKWPNWYLDFVAWFLKNMLCEHKNIKLWNKWHFFG
jgi:hypothetical protein